MSPSDTKQAAPQEASELAVPREPAGGAGVKRPSSCDDSEGAEWQLVERRPKKKAKKIPKSESSNYPSITFSPQARLQSKIQVTHLRDLVLYILADGTAPSWVSVRNRPQFRKIVTILVPGLEEAMFRRDVDFATYDQPPARAGARQATERTATSPDDYYPRPLREERLPDALKPFGSIFPHLWPVRTPGEEKANPRMHSPITSFLTVPLNKSPEDKARKGPKPVRDPQGWNDVRTPVTEFLLSPEEYMQNGFFAHPAMIDDGEGRAAFRDQAGWVHTKVDRLEDGAVAENEIQKGSVTAGREVLAIDCEMCMTGEKEFSLTRISIVRWDGTVILDELVRPDKPIIDYVTRFSGITKGMLEPVTTTLGDIQDRLLELITPRTILVGHSLDSDLRALRLTHPFIVDTSVLFPHPKGPPFKHALKWLAQKYLGREIQAGHGAAQGHNSIEDARTCLDLVKKKCEKGKAWAAGEMSGENLFKRLGRAGTAYSAQAGQVARGGVPVGKSTAAVDWGDASRTSWGLADVVIDKCQSDADVEGGILRAVRGDPDGSVVRGGGVDFVWARMRELEVLQGWWNRNKLEADDATGPPAVADLHTLARDPNAAATAGAAPALGDDGAARGTVLPPQHATASKSALESSLAALAQRLQRIHDALPPCTALIVFSGSGDPREMSRLQALHQQWRREYNTPGKKWDELSVKWTDAEEQALKHAVRQARNGIGFVTVK